MNIPREFIELLLTKIDLVDLINSQIPLRKKSGSNYFACCPFHQEKSASFSVSQPKQFYYCFGCGAHGNAIDFVMQQDRLNFPEAIEVLARQVGMELPKAATGVKNEPSVTHLYDLMIAVTANYYEQMRKSTRAIDYLKNRNISGRIAQQFNIGYAPDSWHHLLEQFGKNESHKKQLLDTGLIIKKEDTGFYDRFRDRIMFPIYDHRGRIIGFGGRILDRGEPKYLNSPETVLFQKGQELYGLYQALKSNRQLKTVLIVEGYMDVIALFQHDITYAVATLGTATTAHHIQRLFRYTNDLVFCFDGDEAGRTAAWRALQVILPLLQDDRQIRFLFLPDGEDPDSLIHQEGKIAFEKRLLTALSLSNFFFHTLSQQSDMTTLEGRAKFAAIALPYIKQLPPGLFQQILLEELSKRARIQHQSLQAQMHPTPTAAIAEITSPIRPQLASPLRHALTLLIQQPSLANILNASLPASRLPGFSLLTQLIEIIKQRPHITTGGLLECFRGLKEKKLLSELAQSSLMVPNQGIESEFLGTLRQLQLIDFNDEINTLLAKAADSGLTKEEKHILSSFIARKKAIV